MQNDDLSDDFQNLYYLPDENAMTTCTRFCYSLLPIPPNEPCVEEHNCMMPYVVQAVLIQVVPWFHYFKHSCLYKQRSSTTSFPRFLLLSVQSFPFCWHYLILCLLLRLARCYWVWRLEYSFSASVIRHGKNMWLLRAIISRCKVPYWNFAKKTACGGMEECSMENNKWN